MSAAIDARHQLNRLTVVRDISRQLLRQRAVMDPTATFFEIVDGVLAFTCGLSDTEWLKVARDCGHYKAIGARPDQDTIDAVVAHLESYETGEW